MITVSGLSKYYSGFAAVDNVSFTINQGEIIGLLGLNGAGKSTILKVLGCFLMPSAGKVEIGGFDIEEAPDQIRKIIGFLPDTPPLFPEMTVAAYLTYVAKLKDVTPDNVKAFVEEAIRKTSLEDVREVRLGELSHGFQQRVGIAGAIVHKPQLLIFDEPINGLDPVQIVEMRDLIKSLKGEHTVILSSHILSEITRTCDRILIIDKGRLVAEGGEEDLKDISHRQMVVRVEAKSVGPSVVKPLSEIKGVEKVQTARDDGNGHTELTIHCDSDARSAIAKTLVGHGAELLEMTRMDDGLESIFVKMVRQNEQGLGGVNE